MKVEPLGFIVLTIEYRRHEKEGYWTARCPELTTSCFGDTFEEAREAILEGIELHLNTLEDVGERARFFKERGIKFHRVKPTQPASLRVAPGPNIVYQRVVQPIRDMASV
jgi:predicted RNase H-like HicB family nuclease